MIGILVLATVASAANPSMGSTALSQGAFIENKGQWNSAARFLMKSPGANLWVTESGAVIDYYKHTSKTVQVEGEITGKQISTTGDVVRVNFVGASSSVVPVGVSKKKSQSNFIVDGQEFNGAASFKEAKLVNVLPGVTARYYLDGGSPRYDVILAAGAKPESVKLKYEGAKNLRVGADGSLQYDISLGTVREQNLFVYQMVNGVKKEVAAKFTINNGQVGFKLAGYDATKPVVIDPQIFLSGTFLGGTGLDEVGAVDVSPSGAIVVAGLAAGVDFPTSTGPYNSDSTGADWFISHLRSDLTDIDVFSTYVSGGGTEVGWAGSTQGMKVRVLDNQDIVFAANGNSTDLPATGGVQTGNGGGNDGYVLRLRANGGTRMFSTYVGGSGTDWIWDMDVNPANGEVAIAMQNGSADFSSTVGTRGPLTAGSAADTTKSGTSADAFVLVLNKSLSAVKMGTFFGGASTDTGKTVNFGRGYNTLVLGGQSQSTTDLTFTNGTVSATTNRELFLARFAIKTAAVQFSTVFGASAGNDTFRGMEMDMVNDRPYMTALVTGTVNSSGFGTTIPVKFGFDSAHATGNDVIVATFSQDLNQAVMTYYGDSGSDQPTDIALQSNGTVQVVGTTTSALLPLNAAGGTNMTATAAATNNTQGFHARFSNGMGLIGASLLGGSNATDTGIDTPYGIALFGTWNNAVVVGQTASFSMQVSTDGFQNTNPDSSGFVNVLAFYTDPTGISFSSNSISDTQTNFVAIELNAPVQNVAGQSVVLTLSPTSAARFSNGTSTITLTVPQGSQRVSTKVFSNQVISPTLVTVSALSSGTTIQGSYTINP
jgi:hypothetical protein